MANGLPAKDADKPPEWVAAGFRVEKLHARIDVHLAGACQDNDRS